MKTMRSIGLTLAVLALLAVPVRAQTVLNNTTFGAAVAATDTTVTVASASTLVVGQLIVVPGLALEVMRITAISGTQISVIRGIRGVARAHASGDTILTGLPGRFYERAPDTVNGTCTRSELQFQPWVDLQSGITWSCNGEGTNTTGTWYGGINTVVAYGSLPTR